MSTHSYSFAFGLLLMYRWRPDAGCTACAQSNAQSNEELALLVVDRSLFKTGRGAYATSVWKSANDGDAWDDETGDLVTISPGPGVWYEDDFYLVTRGEGVMVKRGFETGGARAPMVESK